jgi:hypothetical protein
MKTINGESQNSMLHPTYETLTNYLENRLSDADRIKLEEHLARPCQKCSAKISRLRSILAVTAEDRTIAPPPNVLSRAVALYQKRVSSPLQPHFRVLAALQFDSRLQLSPAAFRGVARAIQLLFTAQQVDIDLQLTPEHGDHNLVGQILGPKRDDGQSLAFVSLQNKTGKLLKGTETDSHGQFAFRHIMPGIYDLIFDIGSQEIAILDLEFSND